MLSPAPAPPRWMFWTVMVGAGIGLVLAIVTLTLMAGGR